MDENLKYFRLSGGDLEADVVLACKPEQEDMLRAKCEGYTLEECEKPEGELSYVPAEPRINPEPFVLHNPYFEMIRDPMERESWGGPCCASCKNRYNLRSDWCYKHQNDNRCYRFRFER